MENREKNLERSRTAGSAKWWIVGAVIAILVVTVLEFPPPIGFETRPQTDVSPLWLLLFLAILLSEIATIALIFKRAALGWKFGVTAGVLNVLQVIADQAHLMQPEVAPFGYSMLEGIVVVLSLALIYFSLRVRNGDK